jgi:hypothetical protein
MSALSTTDSVGKFILCLAGPVIWAAHLAALYGGHTLICARLASSANVWWAVTVSVVTALSLVGVALVVRWQWSPPRPADRLPEQRRPSFLRSVSLALAGLSALALIWNALPAALVPPCS